MFLKIPSLVLKQLYTFGSLANTTTGVRFALKNRLSDATVTAIRGIAVDGRPADLAALTLTSGDEAPRAALSITPKDPLELPLRRIVTLELGRFAPLERGNHEIEIQFGLAN